jgi:hypothetical protein
MSVYNLNRIVSEQQLNAHSSETDVGGLVLSQAYEPFLGDLTK